MVNQSWSEMSGLAAERAIGKTVHEIYPPAQAKGMAEEDAKLMALGADASPIEAVHQGPRPGQWRIVKKTVPALQAQIAPTALSTIRWRELGPARGGRSGAVTGSVARPLEYWMGTEGGGVWKTSDGGANWQPLTDTQCSNAMGSIVLDPSNPQIVYAGTGEENFSGDSYYGCGILKSTDGGATWSRTGAANFVTATGGARIGKLAIPSTAPGTLMVASDFGVYRSTDAGGSYTRVQTGVATDIVIDPLSPSTMYAAIGSMVGAAEIGRAHV